jgi:hypothetical protein
MKKRIAIFVLFAVIVSVIFAEQPPVTSSEAELAPIAPLEVTFSHEAGFYSEAFSLTLSATHENAVIYYTTDGTPPTVDSQRYTAPILVTIPGEKRTVKMHRPMISGVNVFGVNAIAVTPAETTRVFTRSFIRGDDVNERFCENTLVFALTSDPHGLYDHHDGILVPGIDREIFHLENPRVRNPDPPAPANFNRRGAESERPVYVEMFDGQGNLHISQAAGMRVKGGWSRAATQKSLELYARNEYSGSNVFMYPFFGEQEHTSDGNIMGRFRRIRLRNGGNDREFGGLRDELGQVLFRQAGLPDTQVHTPAAIFLNGEYYGFAWLKSPRTENHWWRKYGGIQDNYEHIGTNESGLDGSERAVADWAEVLALAEARNWAEFDRRVDTENMILYYAMQLYINNEDWPNNNMEMWRYFPGDDEIAAAPLDGKWRFIAQDIEFAWNLYGRPMAEQNSIESVRTGRDQMGGQSEILYALLEREDMRRAFADTFAELMEGVFRPENVVEVRDRLVELNQAEIAIMLANDMLEPGNVHWPSQGSVRESQEQIRSFAFRRPRFMVQFIDESLGVTVRVSYL